MKAVIEINRKNVKKMIEKIEAVIRSYLLEYVARLEKEFGTNLDSYCVVFLEEEEIERLQKFGFDHLLKKLETKRVQIEVSFNTSSGYTDAKVFRIAISDKEDDCIKVELPYLIAKTFVLRNEASEYIDEVCEFWCSLMRKFFEEEKKYLNDIWEKFIQTKVYKEVSVLEKF